MLIPTYYDDDVEGVLASPGARDALGRRRWSGRWRSPDRTPPRSRNCSRRAISRRARSASASTSRSARPTAGIVNDPILLRLAQDRFWLSLADSDTLLYALGVQAFAGMDVQIREPDVSPLQIQGPKSKPLMRTLLGDEIADLRYYWCTEADLDGIPLVVSRTGWSGEVGYELYLRDAARGTELWDAVMSRRRGVRDPRDRALGPTADGSRDLQLRQRHGRHEQPVRGHGARAARRAGQRQPGGLARGARTDRARRHRAQARRGADRR